MVPPGYEFLVAGSDFHQSVIVLRALGCDSIDLFKGATVEEFVTEDGERVFSAVEVDSLPGDTGVILRDRWKGYVDELSEVVASADELAKVSAPLQEVYPQDEYSVLMRVEDSDDEIWLKACREMADLVSEHGWVVDKETLPMLYGI